MVEHLKAAGHQVLSEHIISDDILGDEERWAPRRVFQQDIVWLDECDVVIAEVSNPSLGVGYEICYALDKGLNVLCLYQQGLKISKMITGNSLKNIFVSEYKNEIELFEIIDKFLN